MKITAVKPVVVNANMRNWIFVKVETDQPGLYGWGEATLEWKTKTVVGAIEDVSRFIIGEDPRRIEHLYQMMYRQYFWKVGIEGMTAISGIEHALWDIKGKWLNVPVYELLGGRVRDRVRLYNHLGSGQMTSMYESTTPEEFAERALSVKEAGYDAIKFMAVPRTEPVEGTKSVRYAESLVRAVREAVGPDMDLMVDLHARTWPAMAIQYCHAFEPYGLFFFEEPCPPENVDGMAQVARAISLPVATGERLVTRYQFRQLFEKGACAVVQPDLCHCGGLWEARKIAAMAETYYVAIAPHNPLGPVASAANVHFNFSVPNFLIMEAVRADVPWREEVVTNPVKPVNGQVGLPTGPGLGIEVNEEAAKNYPFQQEVLMQTYHDDGSVADW